MTARTTPPFRADHVGSLLRPQRLHEARARAARGEIDRAALRAVEDECIRDAVRFQRSVGLASITDGEYRRSWWHVDFLCGFDGVTQSTESYAVKFGGTEEQPPLMRVTGKIRRTRPNMLDHFTFLRDALKDAPGAVPKFTLPSPAMLHLRSDRPTLVATYPDLAEFWADLGRAYNEELRALYDAGCRYVQIDDTSVSMLCDANVREQCRRQGDDPDALPGIYAEAVNAAVAGLPADMMIATHTCRGNFKSRWMGSGGYDPVAETVFNRMKVNAFFLEYDSERAGGFEPLRFMPKEKIVVLGLVSTKVPEMESADELKRRIDAAAKYVPLDRLCLSPQCGFSSTHHGNAVTEDDQRRKLELVRSVAQSVWGTA
jgi:5-methyltetrahydropteroyltriglutamate--homocysteine methyltransferase